MSEVKSIRRGQIWYISFNDSCGNEEGVGRHAVVVSSNEGMGFKKVLQVVYLTTKGNPSGLNIEVNSAGKRCIAICSQVTPVDKSRFLSFKGSVSDSEMRAIDKAIKKSLFSQTEVDEKDVKFEKLMEEKMNLELELQIAEKMYDRVLNLLVDERIDANMKNRKPEVIVVTPEPPKIEEKTSVESEEALVTEEKHTPTKEKYQTKAASKLKNRIDAAKEKMSGKKANLNTATAEELMAACGMGIGMARIVVKRRRDFGPYKDVSDLLDINQLSDKMFIKYEPFLEV